MKPPIPAVDTPVGIPADYAEYIQLMYDLLVLAFQTDSTRVATLMLAHDGSNRSFEHIGIVEGHHDLSHHRNRSGMDRQGRGYRPVVRQAVRGFLDKLNKVKDADGNSLLHNSMIVYGSGNADGNRHTHDNLPFLLAGAGAANLTGPLRQARLETGDKPVPQPGGSRGD